MKFFFIIMNLFWYSISFSQTMSSFELRYFTKDTKANGETDFKGETEWMNTDQRIRFLKDYRDFASNFFNVPNLNKKVVTDHEVQDVMMKFKQMPLTSVRETLLLNDWKAYGYKAGRKEDLNKKWLKFKGTSIQNGILLLNDASIDLNIDSIYWRFRLEAKLKIKNRGKLELKLIESNNRKNSAINFIVTQNFLKYYSLNKTYSFKINSDWVNVLIEGDFTKKKFNILIDNQKIGDFIPFSDTSARSISTLKLKTLNSAMIDQITVTNYYLTGNKYTPYGFTILLDENFEKLRGVEGWTRNDFDCSNWKNVSLPSVHGGIGEEGEDYFLRKKIYIKEFDRATLNFETIDPGGEVWINDMIVSTINDRSPVLLDVTRFFKKNSWNLIAVKVKNFKVSNASIHAPSDPFIGWFLGRARLILSNNCMVQKVKVFTTEIVNKDASSNIKVMNIIKIQNKSQDYLSGYLEINYYPWFPIEEGKVGSFKSKIEIRPNIENEFKFQFPLENVKLWSYMTPNLYKVEVILRNIHGEAIDDYVTTTGFRIVEQKNGSLYINGKVELLNGAQIFGFRMPLETMAKFSRCAPFSKLVEEILMIKKMNGNLLRIHVHSKKDSADGINDPRLAELADQMGVYLIWQTAGWLREGECWNIDFKNYPKYMEQVINHPSIIMWEASNHPNRFKEHSIVETNSFVKLIYDTISFEDRSRLIVPTTFWQHTQYANYNGTIDNFGNEIQAPQEFNSKNMTRGNQDTYTGYGNDWSVLRKAPNSWAKSCLSSKDKAYFNFEHEESIGQPNWNLCRGKPWYLLQSYEWSYDVGSIGRKLETSEWDISQAWQAFSLWESTKKQILLGYSGFSWCNLHGGPNMGTYKKSLIDNIGYAKLAFYTNQMISNNTWAGSDNVDVVYGPNDLIKPVLYHRGNREKFNLTIELKKVNGKLIRKKVFKEIFVDDGGGHKELKAFRFKNVEDGIYVVQYTVNKTKKGI